MQFTNSNQNNNSTATKFPKGVFIDLIALETVENSDSQYNDCNLFITGNAEGAKYPKKFFIGGNHCKDGKGTLLDWGSNANGVKSGSWKVSAFIEAVTGLKASEIQLNDDGTVHEETLRDMVGREVYILQYESNGKYSRDTWFFFGSKDGGKEYLLDKWNGMKTKPKSYKHANGGENSMMAELWNDGVKAGQESAKTPAEVDLPF